MANIDIRNKIEKWKIIDDVHDENISQIATYLVHILCIFITINFW